MSSGVRSTSGGDLEREALGHGAHDERAVAVDGRVDRQADRGQERVAAARAVADDADLAVRGRQGAQGLDGHFGIAHELVVGDAARLTGGGRGVVGVDIESLACVEIGAEGVVPTGGETAGDLLGARVPPGEVVDHEDPWEGAVAGGERLVGVDLGPFVTGEGHVLGREGFFGCCHGWPPFRSFVRRVSAAPPTMARLSGLTPIATGMMSGCGAPSSRC